MGNPPRMISLTTQSPLWLFINTNLTISSSVIDFITPTSLRNASSAPDTASMANPSYSIRLTSISSKARLPAKMRKSRHLLPLRNRLQMLSQRMVLNHLQHLLQSTQTLHNQIQSRSTQNSPRFTNCERQHADDRQLHKGSISMDELRLSWKPL